MWVTGIIRAKRIRAAPFTFRSGFPALPQTARYPFTQAPSNFFQKLPSLQTNRLHKKTEPTPPNDAETSKAFLEPSTHAHKTQSRVGTPVGLGGGRVAPPGGFVIWGIDAESIFCRKVHSGMESRRTLRRRAFKYALAARPVCALTLAPRATVTFVQMHSIANFRERRADQATVGMLQPNGLAERSCRQFSPEVASNPSGAIRGLLLKHVLIMMEAARLAPIRR